MKMTRDQLKKIVKECLVEILMDGAGEALTERRTSRPIQQATPQMPRRQSVYDMMQVRPQQAPQRQQQSRVNEMVSVATKDPIMAAILADTAQTTLIQQESGDRHGSPIVGGDQASRAVSAHNPVDIFGEEAMSRWNEAAFSKRSLPGSPSMGHDFSLDFDPYAPVKA